jgi:hypothetical protein
MFFVPVNVVVKVNGNVSVTVVPTAEIVRPVPESEQLPVVIDPGAPGAVASQVPSVSRKRYMRFAARL